MATAYLKKTPRTGKPYPCWHYRFKDHRGEWQYGKGWPTKKRTLEHALAVEAEHRVIRRGEKEIPPEWLKLRNTPIVDVIKEYLADGKANGGRQGYGWSERHLTDRRIKLASWVRELSLKTIGDISLGAVQARGRAMLQKGRHGKTVANTVEAMKALCAWAVKHGNLKDNPLAGMPKYNTKPANPNRPLNDKELRRLLEVAPPARKLAYRTALETGFRASEIGALKVSDLDIFGPSLRLLDGLTKNRRDAQQPISRELATDLQATCRGKEQGAPLLDMPKPHTVSENFNRDRSKAKIKHKTDAGKATFHSLRDNFINAVVEAGSDLKTIMTLARHGSAQMSMEVYAKPKTKLLREAAQAASESIKEALKEKSSATGVARKAAGAEGMNVSAEEKSTSGPKGMATPTGFEPVLPG